MNTLKVSIFAEVRSKHEKSINLSDEQLERLMFHHMNGWRLSFTGFCILKNIFTVYSFQIPITLKARHYIGMENMEGPYFITSSRLVLFSEMDTTVVKLCGGIEKFLDTCFNTDR